MRDLNFFLSGYYRVNYDPENWKKLFRVLNSSEEYENIHKYNRAQIIDDCWTLCKNGHLNCSISLQLSTYMKHEVSELVRKSFYHNEIQLINMLYEDDNFDKFKVSLSLSLNLYI